jgi:hypothetical protein
VDLAAQLAERYFMNKGWSQTRHPSFGNHSVHQSQLDNSTQIIDRLHAQNNDELTIVITDTVSQWLTSVFTGGPMTIH